MVLDFYTTTGGDGINEWWIWQ